MNKISKFSNIYTGNDICDNYNVFVRSWDEKFVLEKFSKKLNIHVIKTTLNWLKNFALNSPGQNASESGTHLSQSCGICYSCQQRTKSLISLSDFVTNLNNCDEPGCVKLIMNTMNAFELIFCLKRLN